MKSVELLVLLDLSLQCMMDCISAVLNTALIIAKLQASCHFIRSLNLVLLWHGKYLALIARDTVGRNTASCL